ncbi:hypothetical protein F4803DRAFT_548905 [Xylaria telfairii]|nr:hypothetical protein F4803DRAFT_548905 [Xylaria telfairii]
MACVSFLGRVTVRTTGNRASDPLDFGAFDWFLTHAVTVRFFRRIPGSIEWQGDLSGLCTASVKAGYMNRLCGFNDWPTGRPSSLRYVFTRFLVLLDLWAIHVGAVNIGFLSLTIQTGGYDMLLRAFKAELLQRKSAW